MGKKHVLAGLLMVASAAGPALARESLPKDSPVRTVCTACHQADRSGRIDTIESIRTTPEGWRRIVKRMERNYGLQLTDEQRDRAVRDLGWAQGLSPVEYDELVHYVAQTPYQVLPAVPPGVKLPADMERTCTACHRHEVFSSQRRTSPSWQRVPDFHLGTWPTLFLTHREMRWDLKAAEVAGLLGKLFPYATPAWTGWKGPGAEPPLAGHYWVSGRQDGYGDFQGTLDLTAGQDKDHLKVHQALEREDGKKLELDGEARVFGGYLVELTGKQGEDAVEGVLYRAKPGGPLQLRWTSPDKPHLRATASAAPGQALYHVSPSAVTAGSGKLWLYLPGADKVKVGDVHCGDLKVQKVVSQEQGRLQIEVSVPAQAKPGLRQLTVRGFSGSLPLAVAPAVEFLKVLPDPAVSRMGGGASNPASGVKFEVRGYHPGPDGKRFTDDDLDLGRVDAPLTMEDYASTDWMEDPKFIGKLEADGLFTPASEAPNPDRVRRSNTGDVWICTRWKKPGSRQPMRARTLLRVVVPDYRKDL